MPSQAKLNGKLLFPGNYVSAADLNEKDVPLTIERVVISDLKMEGGASKSKPVIFFRGCKKGLVLNVTNCNTIAEMHGNEVKAWVGKGVILYPTTAMFGGKKVPAIRIRDRAPNGNGQASPPAAMNEEMPPLSEADAEQASANREEVMA